MVGDMGYIENASSLLDQAGEWYLDRKAGTVYYLPLPARTPARGVYGCETANASATERHAPGPGAVCGVPRLRLEHAEWPMPAIGYRPCLGCAYGTQLTPLRADVPCRSAAPSQR